MWFEGNIIPPEPPYDQFPTPTSVPVYKILDCVDVELDHNPPHPPHYNSPIRDDFPQEDEIYNIIKAWLAQF